MGTPRTVLLAIAVAVGACGSSDGGGLGDAAIHPSQLFTGFDDGMVDYKVPASLVNIDDKTTVKWTVLDSSLADVNVEEAQPGEKVTASLSHHAIVVTKKAGKTKLRATAGGNSYEVVLNITQYPVGARELGNDLYQIDRSGGMTTGTPGTKALGCIGCHGGPGSVPHSPSQIGGYDDASILKTIATAVKPDGTIANGGKHKFVLAQDEQTGILARLRSLEPIDFPE